jgi:hypothetical protein
MWLARSGRRSLRNHLSNIATFFAPDLIRTASGLHRLKALIGALPRAR